MAQFYSKKEKKKKVRFKGNQQSAQHIELQIDKKKIKRIEKARSVLINKRSRRAKRRTNSTNKGTATMICDWIQGDYSPSEGHNQQTQTNDQIPHHPSIYHNRNRKLLHIILLLIAILIKCCAVAADTTGEHSVFSVKIVFFFILFDVRLWFVCLFATVFRVLNYITLNCSECEWESECKMRIRLESLLFSLIHGMAFGGFIMIIIDVSLNRM